MDLSSDNYVPSQTRVKTERAGKTEDGVKARTSSEDGERFSPSTNAG